MPVTINEFSTTLETVSGHAGTEPVAPAGEQAAFEVQMEDLRALVRALVAEELERQLRRRNDCP